MNLTIVDDNSDNIIIEKMNLLLNKKELSFNIINLNKNEFNNKIVNENNPETFANLASLFKCFLKLNKYDSYYRTLFKTLSTTFYIFF